MDEQATIALLNRVTAARAGGRVQRMHTIKHNGYSVAEHTFGSLLLLRQLWPADFNRLSSHLLVHDIGEAWVGDTPAPIKKRFPSAASQLRQFEEHILRQLHLEPDNSLSEPDRLKLKACDYLDLYIWCLEELASGNLWVKATLSEIKVYLDDMILPDPASQFYMVLIKQLCQPTILRKVHIELFESSVNPDWHFDPTGMDHPFGYSAEDEN